MMNKGGFIRSAGMGLSMVLVAGSSAAAQSDSVSVVPGAHYAPGSFLHSEVLGTRYRELWSTPILVPVLDLGEYAGGLTPVRTGGFQQTRSLRFEAADGTEYNFRSVDKELTPAMPAFTRETVVDWLRQDQTSAQLPAAPVVASYLLDAVGVLNPGPVLMVLPDDARLGEFGEEFAGMLGTLEVHPDERSDEEPGFAGAVRVAGTERLLEHLEDDLDHRVNSRAFLKARLMDIFLGDYDRHEGQWRWARFDREGLHVWEPIPEDRDYAFVQYDGLALSLARKSGIARLVEFDDSYPDLLAMVDNSLEMTRHLLADLDWPVWAELADELRQGLTDEVIRNAVAQMPASHYALIGEELIADMQSRRDRIPRMARDFYELISHTVVVHGTDAADRVEVDRGDDGVLVRLYAGGEQQPRYERMLDPRVTREVRIYMEGGDDVAVVRGEGGGLSVRVIGGGSDDVMQDSSTGPTYFHDDRGDNQFQRGPRTFVDEKSWPPVPETETEEEDVEGPPGPGQAEDPEGDQDPQDLIPGLQRDWGHTATWFGPTVRWEPHAELVVGGGPRLTRYGFRHDPYRSRFWARALFAPLQMRGGLEAGADVRRPTSTMHLATRLQVNNLTATVFHGYGNQSPSGRTADLRTWHDRANLSATFFLVDTDRVGLGVGGVVDHVDPEHDPLVPVAPPAGDLEPVTRVGGTLAGYMDSSDSKVFPTSGLRLHAEGTGYPAGADRAAYASADVFAAAYLPLPFGVLATRAGAAGVTGDFPFYDAVFLGGSETLRGHHFQRFAGDRAAYGSAEVRVPISPAKIIVYGTLGASAFVDTGRVWFAGESPGGWHSAFGGSVWFRVPVGAASVGYANGEDNRFYFRLGFPF